MEELVYEVTDGDVTTFIVVAGDNPVLDLASLELLRSLDSANGARGDSDFSYRGIDSLPEGAEGSSIFDFASSVDDSNLPGGSAELLLDEQFGRFGLDVADYFDLTSDIGDGSIFGGGGGSGGSSGGGGGGGGTRTGVSADEIDLAALEREGQRLGIEAERLGVTGAEIAALQDLNAEDRALIEEQFDLQREESQRAYVVQSDPARGAANALAAGNFKSGVNGYAARVRALVQGTEIDQLENARARSLNSNSAAGVRLDASAQRNVLDGQELGLAQDAFNDRLSQIQQLTGLNTTPAGAGGSFGDDVLADVGIDLAAGL